MTYKEYFVNQVRILIGKLTVTYFLHPANIILLSSIFVSKWVENWGLCPYLQDRIILHDKSTLTFSQFCNCFEGKNPLKSYDFCRTGRVAYTYHLFAHQLKKKKIRCKCFHNVKGKYNPQISDNQRRQDIAICPTWKESLKWATYLAYQMRIMN